MKSEKLFLLLSNSKYAGQTTCQMMAHANNLNMFLNQNPYNYSKEKLETLSVIIKRDDQIYKEILKNENIKLLNHLLPNVVPAPSFVYALGGGVITDKRIAIIGARNCSDYGKKVAYELAYKLSERGVTIVSGLAYGIDISAHKGALDASGSTIAVLGSGILNCYPSHHKKIYNQMITSGMIISEYGFYAKPLKHHFPFRNRLISGLSDLIIVVEAREKSGTMITVNYALEQGKGVYIVPGNIYSELSRGTHKLIQEGADIITSIEDFIQEVVK